MEFKLEKLIDLDIEIIDGDRGKNYPKKSDMKTEGHTLFLNNKNIINDYLDVSSGEYISEKSSNKLRKGKLFREDIIISTRGSVGNIGYFHKHIPIKNIRINSGMVILRNFDKGIDNSFLYHLLKSPFMKNQYEELASGSVQKQLPIRDMKFLKLMIPKLEYQKKISSFLNNLESKITLNKNIIANLEELSQTLFKRWFIDFEFPDENGNPYKSKEKKFENKQENSALPGDFTIGKLQDILIVIDNRGKTPPLTNKSKEYPLLDVKTLKNNNRTINYTACSKFVDKETYNSWFRNGHPKKYDILFSTVGSIGEVAMYFYSKGTIAQNVVALRSEEIFQFYLYELLKYLKPSLLNYNIGSVQPSIKVSQLIKMDITIPPNYLLEKFNIFSKDFTLKIMNLTKENEDLIQLRDTLLPKLMSGEIELPDELEVDKHAELLQ